MSTNSITNALQIHVAQPITNAALSAAKAVQKVWSRCIGAACYAARGAWHFTQCHPWVSALSLGIVAALIGCLKMWTRKESLPETLPHGWKVTTEGNLQFEESNWVIPQAAYQIKNGVITYLSWEVTHRGLASPKEWEKVESSDHHHKRPKIFLPGNNIASVEDGMVSMQGLCDISLANGTVKLKTGQTIPIDRYTGNVGANGFTVQMPQASFCFEKTEGIRMRLTEHAGIVFGVTTNSPSINDAGDVTIVRRDIKMQFCYDKSVQLGENQTREGLQAKIQELEEEKNANKNWESLDSSLELHIGLLKRVASQLEAKT